MLLLIGLGCQVNLELLGFGWIGKRESGIIMHHNAWELQFLRVLKVCNELENLDLSCDFYSYILKGLKLLPLRKEKRKFSGLGLSFLETESSSMDPNGPKEN